MDYGFVAYVKISLEVRLGRFNWTPRNYLEPQGRRVRWNVTANPVFDFGSVNCTTVNGTGESLVGSDFPAHHPIAITERCGREPG